MSNRKKPEMPEREQRGTEQSGRPDTPSPEGEQQEQQPQRSESPSHTEQTAAEREVEPDRAAIAEAATATEVEALKARIAELEEELISLKDQYLRKQADFENFRKRMQREKEEAAAFANKQLLLDLVGVIDDFERAIQSAGESRDFDSFHDGIALIEKQLVGMLERKWALKRFESAGEPFDPQLHEALMTEEVPDQDQSIVLEDFQKGYLLHDRVLRSAKVKVSMPAAQP